MTKTCKLDKENCFCLTQEALPDCPSAYENECEKHPHYGIMLRIQDIKDTDKQDEFIKVLNDALQSLELDTNIAFAELTKINGHFFNGHEKTFQFGHNRLGNY